MDEPPESIAGLALVLLAHLRPADCQAHVQRALDAMGHGQNTVRVDQGAAAEVGAVSLLYGQYRHKRILAVWHRLAAHYLRLDSPLPILGPDGCVIAAGPEGKPARRPPPSASPPT